MQSVVAHCSALWSTALVISGPERLPEGDRKRIKDRVLKLVHGSIKSVVKQYIRGRDWEARQNIIAIICRVFEVE